MLKIHRKHRKLVTHGREKSHRWSIEPEPEIYGRVRSWLLITLFSAYAIMAVVLFALPEMSWWTKRGVMFICGWALVPMLLLIHEVRPGTKRFWIICACLVPLMPILPWLVLPVYGVAILYGAWRLWDDRQWRHPWQDSVLREKGEHDG